ncbi:MAG: TetR/AcrR family transcriptional regulator [Clostridia bacterium]|nr:TetR/AcrR family transcriptional regulator [Clostridia bacterium]
MVVKKTNRDIKSEETKNRIIEASKKLFRKYGCSSVSIQQICEAAEVSTGTLYHFFGSKNKLQEIFYKDVTAFFKKNDFDYETVDIYDFFRKFIEDFYQLLLHMGAEEIYGIIFTSGTGNKSFYDENRPNHRNMIEGIEKLQELGRIRKDIPALRISMDLSDISIGVFAHCYTMECMDRFTDEAMRLQTPYIDTIAISKLK